MRTVLYATGNAIKFDQARHACREFGITLTQSKLAVPEIQGTDPELIARDKAQKAYEKFQQPLVTSDDSWSIPGLNGFPGAYMRDVNEWFSVQNWLALTRDLTDRRIILRQTIVYQDESGQQVFYKDIEGVLLKQPRGKSDFAHAHITSIDGGKTSTAESHATGKAAGNDLPNAWHEFAEWYSNIHG